MLYTFIDSINRSSDVNWNSLSGKDELQERVDSLTFGLQGDKPTEYLEVFMYDGAEIRTVGSNFVIVLDLNSWRNVFREGDTIWVGLNTSDEAEYVISSIDEVAKKITFTTNLSGISAGEFIGQLVFAGNVITVDDQNQHSLENISFIVQALDFTKLFDKGQVVDTFEDRTPRYIINDFCNNFINFNQEIDQLNYDDNAAIQAEYTESGVGNPALSDGSNPYETDHWGSFASSAGGTATWEAASLPTQAINSFAGVVSGAPTKGFLRMWIKHTDVTDITSYLFRIGSSASDYLELTGTPANLGIDDDGETYIDFDLTAGSVTGTPDWTAIDFMRIQFVCTGSTTVKLAGIRIMEEKYFAHYPFVQETEELETFNINYLKPMAVMQTLARLTNFFWDIDKKRQIHYFSQETNNAPFNLTETSSNFIDLSIKLDAKNLKNVQFVEGGEDQSSSITSQTDKGDDSKREWLLRAKFANLSVEVDDQTTSNAAEAGTNTTNIKITGHGLVTGDYITNRTRSNTIRRVNAVVDPDNITVESVTGQTTGDTVTYFDQVQTIGIEGITDETTVDYVYNSNASRVRASEQTPTLTASEFILFNYNERFQIITSAQNGVSIAAMINTLGHTNGQVFGRIIRNKDIKSQSEAKALGAAEVERYGNAILTAKFKTHVFGLETGQQIRITDTSGQRNIDQNFMIQKITYKTEAGQHLVMTVTASSVLYGIVEFFQQLLKASLLIEFDENAVPINLIQSPEDIAIADTFEAKSKNTQAETVAIADVNSRLEPRTPPYKWGPSSNTLEWSLGEWG